MAVPKALSNIYGWFKPEASNPPIRPQVKSLMGGAGLQAINQVGETFAGNLDPWVTLGTSFSQSLIALYSIFNEDTKLHEKGLQSLKFLFAATEVGLSIALICQEDPCLSMYSSNLCTALGVFQTLYISTLGIAGVAATASSGSKNSEAKNNNEEVNNSPETEEEIAENRAALSL